MPGTASAGVCSVMVGVSPLPKEGLPGDSPGFSWGSNDLSVINANNSPIFFSKVQSALRAPFGWDHPLAL